MVIRNAKTETIIRVDYTDVEAAIEELYGQTYEIMPMEEVGSSQYGATYEVTAKDEPLSDFDQSRFEKFFQGNAEQYSLHVIMNHMCCHKHIVAGKYVINVSW